MAEEAPAEGLAARDRSPKLAHRIAAVLRRQIVRGEIPADARLPSEVELMAAFEVSRETVREALSILASESLIRVKRGRGGGPVAQRPHVEAAARYVSLMLHSQGVRNWEVREAKELLERDAAGILAAEPPDGALERLERLHGSEREAVHSPLDFVDAVSAFDEAVLDLSGNPALSILAGTLGKAYVGTMYAVLAAGPDPARIAVQITAHHAGFLDTVRRRDGAAGARAWSAYVSGGGWLRDEEADAAALDVVPLWRAQAARARSAADSGRRTDSIALELRARLAAGELRAGDRLSPVPELAHQFGVSLPTMREVMRVLESEGLLLIRAGVRTGPVVQAASVQNATTMVAVLLECSGTTMGDVWETRTLVEPAIMAIAAQRIGDAGIEALRTAHADAEAVVHDMPGFLAQLARFRFTALEPAGNRALVVILEIIRWLASGSTDAITQTSSSMPWQTRANRRVVAHVYRGLLDAYEAHDGERAALVWANHLSVSVPLFRASLADRFISDLAD